MIGLDLDGTILNYNGHSEKIEVNYGLLKLLPDPGRPVVIVTNQGGMAFNIQGFGLGVSKYPSPEQVAARLRAARRFLNTAGYPVVEISVSTDHPKASMDDIVHAAANLEKEAYVLGWTDTLLHVYTTPLSRKPEPLMLQEAGVVVYYGDSPEDAEAAKRAGIQFVHVPRFLGGKG